MKTEQAYIALSPEVLLKTAATKINKPQKVELAATPPKNDEIKLSKAMPRVETKTPIEPKTTQQKPAQQKPLSLFKKIEDKPLKGKEIKEAKEIKPLPKPVALAKQDVTSNIQVKPAPKPKQDQKIITEKVKIQVTENSKNSKPAEPILLKKITPAKNTPVKKQKKAEAVVASTSVQPIQENAKQTEAAQKQKIETNLKKNRIWEGKKGYSLKGTLKDWCKQNGVVLTFKTEERYDLKMDIYVSGKFENALKTLFSMGIDEPPTYKLITDEKPELIVE